MPGSHRPAKSGDVHMCVPVLGGGGGALGVSPQALDRPDGQNGYSHVCKSRIKYNKYSVHSFSLATL